MSEFGDLKNLRAILDSLTPPMVMVGRCQTCHYWTYNPVQDHCFCDNAQFPNRALPQGAITPATFGCTLWRKGNDSAPVGL